MSSNTDYCTETIAVTTVNCLVYQSNTKKCCCGGKPPKLLGTVLNT